MKHLGPVLPLMLVLSLATGAVVALRPAKPTADQSIWTFGEGHAAIFRNGTPTAPSLVERYRERTGRSVDVQLLSYRALEMRLLSMMLSPQSTTDVPDIVAIEISSVGKFFRAPAEDVGLLPMNDYLARSGWDRKLLAARLAPYSKDGQVFGIPYDVHPMTIAYREDLFAEAGVDLSRAATWPEFQEACLEAQRYWRSQGHADRFAMELSTTTVEWLVCLLMQRGINPIGEGDRVWLDDQRVAETVAFYARMVAGPRRIGAPSPSGGGGYRDIVDGRRAAWFCPDWRPMYMKTYAARIDGKVRMMPLPRFDPSDAPTATWGGTMFGIPRNCRDPDAAWELLEAILLTDEAVEARRRQTTVLAPVVSQWDDPLYDAPDPYFGGQQVMRMYVDLARQAPERFVTPFTPLAQTQLTGVLAKAMRAVESGQDTELETLCRGWLREAAAELERRVAFGKFD